MLHLIGSRQYRICDGDRCSIYVMMKFSSDIDGVFSLDVTIVSENCSWAISACEATMTATTENDD
jgi:hypothetical protein